MGSAESRPGSEAQLAAVARRFGTPLYVMDASALARAAEQVERAFPAPWVLHYSLKANDLPAVTALLAERGWGANVVSVGEWELARAAGVAAGRTTVEGIGKTDADLAAVVDSAAEGRAVRWVSVESRGELARLTELSPTGQRTPRRASRRRCPRRSTCCCASTPRCSRRRRTIWPWACRRASSVWRPTRRARRRPTSLIRTCAFVVSTCTSGRTSVTWSPGPWRDAGQSSCSRSSAPPTRTPTRSTSGAGSRDSVTPRRRRTSTLRWSRELDAAGLRMPPVCAIEPGRSVVSSAGTLVAGVLHARSRPPYPQQIVLDAGMTELIRPALYGSRHPVTVVARAADDANGLRHELMSTAVEGPICESTDSFGLHQLPRLSRGDLVALGEAGAYCASFTSRYNGRPHPREVVLAEDGSCTLGERTDLTRSTDSAAPTPSTTRHHPPGTDLRGAPHERYLDTTRPRTTVVPVDCRRLGGRPGHDGVPHGRDLARRRPRRRRRGVDADAAGGHGDQHVQPVPRLLRRRAQHPRRASTRR